jgi:hypothetical protein
MTFNNYHTHLVQKKEEYQSLKRMNDQERDEIKREQRIAK